ncbi:MAG: SAM-dependent methyltransferase, partial [Thermoguttaceae bacterium]|nr:SAM-dependent methyltransferase [Thermoguttaceae bacterium]
YYTAPWLARRLIQASGYSGVLGERFLDPSCGAGVFLVEAIRRALAATDPCSADPRARCRDILANLVGYDANPLAVLAARASYVMTLADLLPGVGPVNIPVELRDSVLDPTEAVEPFDYVVGNPPWIAWDHLPAEYREATKPLWHRYGLFSLSGSEGRHGGGKKDLAMLLLYVAADRYLKHGGRLAMVVTQTVFQTRGAGDGFRRFRLGAEGAWLGVVEVHDLVEIRPFDAANWTATVVLEKGRPTVYPVPYVKWKRADAGLSCSCPSARTATQRYDAWPVDPRRPTAPWFLWPSAWSDGEGRNPLEALVGPSDYQAHLGANTGGANGVYWLSLVERAESDLMLVRNLPDRGKHRGPPVEHLVEAELVHPLLRWGDVSRFRAVPHAHLLLVQDAHTRRGIDEAAMRQRYPNALAYLTRFQETLCRRAAYRRYQGRGPFYAMYNVGPYTLAPCKVVWRRMDRRIRAAVVEPTEHPWLGARPVIPQETCVFVATESSDEAHYLAAQLNSAIVGFLATAHGVRGGKGFGTPGVLEYLGIRRYDPATLEHRELAALSRHAHAEAAAGNDLSAIEERIDRLVAGLRGLPWRHVARMREEFA